MMKSAYDQQLVYNLRVIKLAKRWLKHEMIQAGQFDTISENYRTPLYHPNFAIRILLLIATLIATSGLSGLVLLMFSDAGETIIALVCMCFGAMSFVILEKMFIRNRHYKSGVTEGIAYMGCGYVIVGFGLLLDFESVLLIQLAALLVFAFAALRYIDLLLTLALLVILSWTIFYHCYEAGGYLRSLIPFVFMIVFTGVFFVIRKWRKHDDLNLWSDNLLLLETGALILIYAGGNYFVVRELSIEMMGLELLPGEDIPFALFFYVFTLVIPLIYIGFGVKHRNIVWIRTGLVTVAFTVYTFKHYFLPDYTGIFLMASGALSIAMAIGGIRHLKKMRRGFTSENIFSSEWANLNVETFIISQTMGGNQPDKAEIKETGGGGSTGGGGASSTF